VRSVGGEWREANRLSHGTREQIYLLLRIALSQHLVGGPERAPLLFDEVTAHCDASRRESVLLLLPDVSAERQVIAFTHEDPVRAWADATLTADRDRLFLRDPVPIA
ncbi:MAG: ATP-binding protein, partial [Vicinamibacterales bacterium]